MFIILVFLNKKDEVKTTSKGSIFFKHTKKSDAKTRFLKSVN